MTLGDLADAQTSSHFLARCLVKRHTDAKLDPRGRGQALEAPAMVPYTSRITPIIALAPAVRLAAPAPRAALADTVSDPKRDPGLRVHAG